jgi:hypothetical protein
MRITETHRRKLCEMMSFAFAELRRLGRAGKSEQVADLAETFHGLPKSMWEEDFNVEFFRDAFLIPYREKYPGDRTRDYVALMNEIIAIGEDYKTN